VTDTRASVEPGDELLPWRRRAPRRRRDEAVSRVGDVVPFNVVPFNNVRRRAATALLASKRAAPHALTYVAADFSGIERVRSTAGLTALPFVARAVVDALREFPLLNASVDGEALIVHRSVNIGIAVDLDYEGLVVPVVRDADGMRLRGLAAAFRELATRARAKQLGPDDLAGGTFTITNPGASGTWISVPILNSPQVGILATDGVAKRVVADDNDSLRIAPVANLCLSFDHRALDGAYAGAFLRRLREIVEQRDWAAEL
jgi:pyruvate dehydrogenase E2 component (dihydrolipoamide acetyltransferase)